MSTCLTPDMGAERTCAGAAGETAAGEGAEYAWLTYVYLLKWTQAPLKRLAGSAPCPASMSAEHRCTAAAGETAAGEEAEYAWLAQPSLKPFNQGDLFGDAEAPRTGDTTLQACVAAAERAMRANIAQVGRSVLIWPFCGALADQCMHAWPDICHQATGACCSMLIVIKATPCWCTPMCWAAGPCIVPL